MNRNFIFGAVVALAVAVVHAQSPSMETKQAQQLFPTPQAAIDSLLEACKNDDTAALVRMLGPGYGAHLEKMDDAEERQHRADFYEKTREFMKIEEQEKDRAVLIVGRERWPVPVPLVKESAGWRFDTEEGMEEMLARRIGENELAAIEVCREYVRAQVEYARIDRDDDKVREFAQRIISTEGKRDGLYWDRDPQSAEHPSPFEALLPDDFDGLRHSKSRVPYMGYYYKVLTRQGANPPGGKYDYVINGNMIAGFALIAWPADYRASGVMTFAVNHQGALVEKDFGPDTAKLAEPMTEFNPDDTWNPTDD
ncbi:MAG TPA: DUF2950 domain-containing protein [Phycisphaerae bacterium]|nr:DUF2950 domain-containing protein [Phycisphaerae bacterium]